MQTAMAQTKVMLWAGCATLEPQEPPPSSTLCNTLYMWPDSGGPTCLEGSAVLTDHYSAVYEPSTDSAASEQEALACHELLCTSGEPYLDSQAPAQPLEPQPVVSAVCRASTLTAPAFGHGPAGHSGVGHLLEVLDTLRNEMRRELEIQPASNYFKRHAFLTTELRETAVSWAVQVVGQFGVEQETLFLAVSYLDRFLSLTQEVVHMDGLHLATLACLSLAAKQTEVTQPTTTEWTWLVQSNSWGTKDQLTRMEWIILDCLEWRGCTPTAWWFLHLFCYGLGTCPAPAICMAAYLLELGLLDAGGLAFRYSSLAAAALLLGHSAVEHHQALAGIGSDSVSAMAQPLTVPRLQMLASDLNLHQVQDACKLLAGLHALACKLPELPPETPAQGLALARIKYRADVWHGVGSWPVPVDLALALERF